MAQKAPNETLNGNSFWRFAAIMRLTQYSTKFDKHHTRIF